MRVLDGDATVEEQAELGRAVASDPAALERHAGTVALEGLLLGEAPGADVVPAVLARIEEQRGARLAQAVLSEVSRRRPRWLQSRRRARWVIPALALALTAALVLVVGRRPEISEPAREGAATVVEAVSGDAVLLRAGRRRALTAGTALHPGDGIETARKGSARVRYAQTTTLRLGSESHLRLPHQPEREASLVIDVFLLDGGALEAEVATRPPGRLVAFRTPHAEATVAGTRLALVVTSGETRLSVTEGWVIFRQLHDGTTRQIGPGGEMSAIASAPGATSALVVTRQPPDGMPDSGGKDPETLFAFDFEDGVLPRVFRQGHLAKGEACPQGGSCLLGTINPYGARNLTVMFHASAAGPLFRYRHGQVIAFDYWVGADTQRLIVQVWNPTQYQNFHTVVRPLVRERWAHAEVSISDFVSNIRKGGRLQPDDPLMSVMVQGGRTGGQPLYVDNLRVTSAARTRP